MLSSNFEIVDINKEVLVPTFFKTKFNLGYNFFDQAFFNWKKKFSQNYLESPYLILN